MTEGLLEAHHAPGRRLWGCAREDRGVMVLLRVVGVREGEADREGVRVPLRLAVGLRVPLAMSRALRERLGVRVRRGERVDVALAAPLPKSASIGGVSAENSKALGVAVELGERLDVAVELGEGLDEAAEAPFELGEGVVVAAALSVEADAMAVCAVRRTWCCLRLQSRWTSDRVLEGVGVGDNTIPSPVEAKEARPPWKRSPPAKYGCVALHSAPMRYSPPMRCGCYTHAKVRPRTIPHMAA